MVEEQGSLNHRQLGPLVLDCECQYGYGDEDNKENMYLVHGMMMVIFLTNSLPTTAPFSQVG